MESRPVIYQLLPRLFANFNEHCVPDGTIQQNGSGKLNDITPRVLKGIKELGVTHVWYTGVIEHAHATDYSSYGIAPHNPRVIKGKAGSPYAITDYYDIDPDLAVDVEKRMDEFEALVKRTHAAGLKVIIDFVPNHVGRQYHSDAKPTGIEDFGVGDDPEYFFKDTNDFYYIPMQQFSPTFNTGEEGDPYIEFPAKASGNDCFTAFPGRNDWYETVKLNYGIDYGDGSRHFDPIPGVWFKMLHILRFWAAKGVDAFRCDMAFMVPSEFWHWVIPQVKERYPNIKFIAEIYDVALYRDFIGYCHFDYLYDKVNLYDTLRGIECSDFSAARLTGCWQALEGIAPHMLNFLENHDEQRFASEFYATDAERVLPSLVMATMMSTGPVMIYAGQELGERGMGAEGFSGLDGRTTIFDYWTIPTVARWIDGGKCTDDRLTAKERRLRGLYAHVLKLCNGEKALCEGGFFDLMYVNYQNPTLNPHRQFVFLRHASDATLLIAVNFDRHACHLEVNVPLHAFEYLGLKPGQYAAVDLLTGREDTKTLSFDEPFVTEVAAHGAVVWRMATGKQPSSKTSNSKKP